MAVEQAQAKVEASVFAIVTAFTSGLDVFTKLRDRRGKKKKSRKTHSSKSHPTPVQHLSDDELQLGKSLQRGPVEIQDCYQTNRSHAGGRFAQGDAISHASLTEVLLKLNTGLVAIISTFLCHGKSESNLDFKSLARLSDCSRSEAIDALDQLYRRLSQSQVNLDGRGPYCSSCHSPKHADCGSVVDLQSTRGQKPVEKPRSLLAVKQAPNGAAPPLPTRAPKTKGSQSQLVMVRPRKSRLKPSSSTPAMQSGKPSTLSHRSLSPDATTTAGAQRPPPPPKLHKLPKKKVFRSMTSLAAEPIPEHALPSSPPLPWSLVRPPYPGSPVYNRSESALRRSNSYMHSPRNAASGPAPPKPPKIPLAPQQREQRNHEPTSNLLPYSPYPATLQTPAAQQPTSQRSHSRLRPQRHSSMPPIPLAERPAAASPPPKSQPTPPPQPTAQSQPAPHPDVAQNHHYHHQLTTTTAFPAQPPQASAHPTPPPPRRRSTVPVPASIYSFKSDSTKLGEIPMARWADGPWDAERAARLNAEAGWGGPRLPTSPAAAAAEGLPNSASGGGGVEGKGADAGAGDVRKKRGGRFGALWRWGSSGSVSGSEKEKDRGRRGVKA